jgi:hypothetical protein
MGISIEAEVANRHLPLVGDMRGDPGNKLEDSAGKMGNYQMIKNSVSKQLSHATGFPLKGPLLLSQKLDEILLGQVMIA